MQGFNMGRYVPPDQEGLVSGNKLHGKHALGARASKLRSDGALTVRFEMPFPVWCATCPKPTIIGQGVRFNAEKRRAGNYYSTPVWSFRMRHAACGGELEIRTDPANTAYVIASGGRRRDAGEDRHAGDSLVGSGIGGGGVPGEIVTDQERRAQREGAFANLEKTIEDRAALAAARERLDELEDASARGWEDPYARNRRLRQAFRASRKEREREAGVAEDLKERMSLGIELVPASEEDARRAALVDFGGVPDGPGPVERALAQPLFGGGSGSMSSSKAAGGKEAAGGKKRLKAELAVARSRENLASEIVGNTRMIKDPFLEGRNKDGAKTPARLPRVKRKRPTEEDPEPAAEKKATAAPSSTKALVAYDSD